MLHYCILIPNLNLIGHKPLVSGGYLYLLIFASVCIAAAGNIINDYFDLNIDRINKPHKIIIDKVFSRRTTIILHLLLSFCGVVSSFYVAHYLNIFWLGILNSITVILLFIYSASLKKNFLVGNILVSALTSWVLLVLLLPEYSLVNGLTASEIEVEDKILRLGILYAAFSFMISLIREIIKDAEDIDGDRKNNCKTVPIVLGINATKVFVGILLIILIGLLIIAQIYVLRYGWWHSILYGILFLIIPLTLVFKKLLNASNNKNFGTLSSYIKLIMLAGILSMIFFRLYI